MYPRVIVNLDKIAHNVKAMTKLCGGYGINILGVTKVFGGDRRIAETMALSGITMLGDSRIDNIINYQDLACEKWLIRMPQAGDAARCVKYCDVSVNSELKVLTALQEEASRQNKTHKVIIMVDLGDLREGCIEEEELSRCVSFVKNSKNLELYGLGTNLTCFSFVQPDTQKLTHLAKLAAKYGAGTIISGGNSATIQLMLNGGIPREINNLRLGESVLFGRERAGFTYLEGMYNDAFLAEAEIIECKVKPSRPIGTIGCNSYGEKPVFKDKGKRLRAILAMGRQDIDQETMWPVDEGIEILGASSDHFVVDITDAARSYSVGDIMAFRLGYFATMRAFTSRYVEKVYVGGGIKA